MICGLEIPVLDTWDTVEPVLYAAEKYDMPGPASIVRALLRTPTFVDAPLRLYAAACHFGWAEDPRAAPTRSLTLNRCTSYHSSACARRTSTRSLRSTTNDVCISVPASQSPRSSLAHSLLISPLHGAQSVANRYRTWSDASCGL